ncbi:MAG: hypothetical protein R3D86_12825 [Emcibacteraceae bacterium]
MKKVLVSLLLIATTAGCANGRKSIIVLQHPETKQTAECKGDPWNDLDPWSAAEKCAKDYETAGYKRLDAEL